MLITGITHSGNLNKHLDMLSSLVFYIRGAIAQLVVCSLHKIVVKIGNNNKKSLDPLRAKKTFIRKKLGHTMVSAIKYQYFLLESYLKIFSELFNRHQWLATIYGKTRPDMELHCKY